MLPRFSDFAKKKKKIRTENPSEILTPGGLDFFFVVVLFWGVAGKRKKKRKEKREIKDDNSCKKQTNKTPQTKPHSRVKMVKPILFQEGRGRRQQTNISLLSIWCITQGDDSWAQITCSFSLLATKLLTVASLSWFRTHACILLICTNHLISKSAHTSKSPMQRKDILKERSVTRVQQFRILPIDPTASQIANCLSKIYWKRDIMTRIHRQREGRKSYFSQSLVQCALLIRYLYKLEKVLYLHASIK